MKNKSTISVFAVMLMAAFRLSAQSPVITSTSIPRVGDKITLFPSDITTFTMPTGGASMTWDYSHMKVDGGIVDSMKLETMTPSKAGNSSDFPSASIAIKNSADGFTSYYTTNNNKMVCIGSVINNGTQKIVRKYSNTWVQYVYPFAADSMQYDSFYGTYYYSGYDHYAFGHHKMNAIGYGDLKMPKHTFTGVLLVRDSLILTDSAYYNGAGSTKKTTYQETFSFLVPNRRTPVFIIINLVGTDVNGDPTDYTSGFFNDDPNLTGIEENENYINNSSLYPNPVADKAVLTIDSKSSASAVLYINDIMGRNVQAERKISLVPGTNNIEINSAGLTRGVYLVKLQGQGVNMNSRFVVE